MPTTREVAFALFGAWRLALFDRSGMDYFDRSPAAALRSFATAVVVVPAYLLLAVVRFWDQWSTLPLIRFAAVEGLSFSISWTGYLLAMFYFARFLDREAQYPGFVTAYNWSALLQLMVYLPVSIAGEAGLLPGDFGSSLMFGATLVIMAYQCFVTKAALDLPFSTAFGLVLLDFIVSAFVSGVADDMLCGIGGVTC